MCAYEATVGKAKYAAAAEASFPFLSQYSFRGLMIVIATGFIPLIGVCCLDIGYVAWKEYCAEYWLKELTKAWVGAMAAVI